MGEQDYLTPTFPRMNWLKLNSKTYAFVIILEVIVHISKCKIT